MCCVTDGTVALTGAVVTPVNMDAITRTSGSCVAAASDSTVPDEPPSSLLAVVSSDEPSTQLAGLPTYDTDIVTESAAVVDVSSPGSATASFITSSSSCTSVTQSYLPCGNVSVRAADFDMVTSSDCLLHSVPDGEDDEEMAADEQIEDWDHEVFDP